MDELLSTLFSILSEWMQAKIRKHEDKTKDDGDNRFFFCLFTLNILNSH